MKSRATPQFWKQFQRLPSPVQQQARETYRRWLDHSDYPGLDYKQVHDTRPIYSVRIGIHYRAVGIKHREHMLWFWIGAHAEYDWVLRNL